MVAGSIPAGCVLEITLETASIQASMAILSSKLLANGCARKCTKTHEIRQVFDKRLLLFLGEWLLDSPRGVVCYTIVNRAAVTEQRKQTREALEKLLALLKSN